MTITDTAPCEKRLRLHVPADAIRPIREAVLVEVQRQAALPGFRKGKAPVGLIERQFAQSIQEETIHRVTQQTVERAATDHQLKPVGPFEVSSLNFSETEGLVFEATVEVEPAFTLGTYKGIPLTQEPPTVSAQDLDQALAKLQESMAQMVPSGQGEAKERQVPPINDELAKDLGVENLEQLKDHVQAKLLEQRRTASAQALEASLCEELLKRHPFEVPPRLVSHQTERLTRDAKVRLLLSGVSEAQLDAEVAKFAEQLRTSAERYVRLSFILDRIAASESVTVSQDELVGRLWQLARRWKKDPTEVRKIFDERGLWPSVMSTLRQEKTITRLLATAVISDGAGASPAPAVAARPETPRT